LAALAAGADWAALVAVVPREPAVPVRARVLPDLVVLLLQRPVAAVRHPLREPAAPLLARPLGLGDWVHEPAAQVQLLLSRQSFSAAMARSSS
jgi:hypothetical protein